MLSSCFSVFLLASICSGIAHGLLVIPSVSSKVLVTSSLKSFASGVGAAAGTPSTQSQQNLLSLEDAAAVRGKSSSVVRDWSLVCKQLCGVGLGGAACAPCASVSVPTLLRFDEDIQRDLICKDLCTLQLGEKICNCMRFAAPSTTAPDRNVACQTFCEHGGKTLSGCSSCKSQQIYDNDSIKRRQIDTAAARDTTPNWNELCAELCKTGDGGSLCNCDLSPFFR